MRKIKYIIIDGYTPILFADHLIHSDVAAKHGGEVTGAGFCHIGGKDEYGNPQFVCYGESVSLNVRSQPSDSAIVNRAFGCEA